MSQTKRPARQRPAAKDRQVHRNSSKSTRRTDSKVGFPIQFNWRRQWAKKVAPFLNEEIVQISLDLGMGMLDKDWKRGDAPFCLGAFGFRRIVKGKLSWYQPLNRCHHISLFSMAIGVLNYPDLDWRFVSGDRHTVPVGYDADGKPRMVMDILLSEYQSAEASLSLAQEDFPRLRPSKRVLKMWNARLEFFVAQVVPVLRKISAELRNGGSIKGSILVRGGKGEKMKNKKN